jgi:hypothetical protein
VAALLGAAHAASVPIRFSVVCIECGAQSASPSERGWRAYRCDNSENDEPPTLAFYCPRCAVAEFGLKQSRTKRD